MSVDRPTFSENWHRVDKLKPRLLSSIRNFRQQFRGRMWHVLADPANNQYFRLDAPAYYFIGLLDGRRTIAEAWDSSNTAFGDSAPTQGEVIRLLGQLYTSNLLHADLPPDAQQMFSRYHKRVTREVRGYLSNFLFVRVPLFDPNRILNNWVHLMGWMFGPIGMILWAALIGAGFYFLAGHWGELLANASPQELLKTENAILLYFCFAAIKAIHEFGHGFACKHFGRKNGVGGDVHTMGIMLLVFAPVPYVDASSS
ncbi:MAG: PqqD family protein, partial [Phycisphaerae bacterium]|nr:PqqD family protein [Phycisphaerae bacterium]